MRRVHWYYKFLLVFLIFFSMFFLLNKNMSKIVNSSVYKGYISYVGVVFNFIDRYNIFRYKSVLDSNDYLKKKTLYTSVSSYENDSLIEEIELLKKELNLKSTYSSYDIKYAKTIIRNRMYWFNTITIDKGLDDGIEEGDAVITSSGLIGSVKSVAKNSSVVKLITNNDSFDKISVMIRDSKSSVIGNVVGYEYPYILVLCEDNLKNVKVGSKLVTSGLGNFPRNIYVGKVEKIKKDNYKITNTLYVLPDQDMNDITYVGVLKSK